MTLSVREVGSVASDPGSGAPASQACVLGDRPDKSALLIFAEGGDTRNQDQHRPPHVIVLMLASNVCSEKVEKATVCASSSTFNWRDLKSYVVSVYREVVILAVSASRTLVNYW